jgi:methylenetetrahydrofolate dehydrogenase (NADP+) / methenyltetrahydrofolate cyclohydrolase
VTEIVDGKKIASDLQAELCGRIEALGGSAPGLATVRVGDDPASIVYLRGKHRACARVGIRSLAIELAQDTSQSALLERIDALNHDPAIHGLLVQLPVPRWIDPAAVARAIAPEKDVDGLHPLNAGKLMSGQAGLVPCTPLGCMEILRRHHVAVEGARAVVIGRSNIVGRPVAMLLEHAHATVTICHSRTRDLAGIVRTADIVVAAAGAPGLVKGEWIREGAVVLDVGIHRLEGGIVGDVEFDSAVKRAALITPVPGGVGPLTIAMLLANTVTAYERATASARS